MFQNHCQLKPFIIFSLFFLLSIIAVDTGAQPCYAIAVDDVETNVRSHFVEFDIKKGYSKYIAELDANIKALAVDPSTGKIYTARFNEFGTLNPVTGQFKKINNLGTMNGEYGTFTPDSIMALAFNPFEGIIYAVDCNLSKFGSDPGSEDLLFKINPISGEIIKASMQIEHDTIIVTDYAVIEAVDNQTLQRNAVVIEPIRDVWDLTINPYTGELIGYHRIGVYGALTILNAETGKLEVIIRDVSFKDYLGTSFSKDGNSLYLTSGLGYSFEQDPNILKKGEFFGTDLGELNTAGFIDAKNYFFKTIDCTLPQYLPYEPCKFEMEITNMMENQTAYEAQEVINSNLYVSYDTEFYAGTSISLFPGFEVNANADFAVYISNCN